MKRFHHAGDDKHYEQDHGEVKSYYHSQKTKETESTNDEHEEEKEEDLHAYHKM